MIVQCYYRLYLVLGFALLRRHGTLTVGLTPWEDPLRFPDCDPQTNQVGLPQ